MPLKRKPKILRPSGNSNWARAIPSAIAPSFWDDSKFSGTKTNDAILGSFLKYVEEQRLVKNGNGPKTLRDTATEVSLRMLSEVDDLDGLPKHLARSLWGVLDKRCMLSFNAWKVLSKALWQEPDVTLGLLQYRQAITFPTSSLRVYTDPLTSKYFDFITSLSISAVIPPADLVQLAKMPNLGILEIISLGGTEHPVPAESVPSSIGDLLIRAWSREAISNGAFPVLRILRMWNHDMITQRCLQYLHAFPSLGIFDVQGCSLSEGDEGIYDAEKFGWMLTSNNNSLDVLEQKILQKTLASGVKKEHGFLPVRISRTRPVWDRAKVHRVKGSAVQTILKYTTLSPGSSRLDPLCCTPPTGEYSWSNDMNEVAEVDKQWVSLNWSLFGLVRDTETWNATNRECWARLGEIREDADLVKAGVRGIGEQIVIGNHLISPIPMAYIRLGERFDRLLSTERPVNEHAPTHRHLVFVRVESHISTTSSVRSASKLVPGRIRKRKVAGLSGVRQSKKQNLGNEIEDLNFLQG